MEWLLPSLNNAKLLQALNSSTFGSSSTSDVPPPPSLSMEPEESDSHNNNNIITLDDESDEDDGPPMLDLAVPAPATQKRSSSILNVPVLKEQFSIIEAHKDDQPKTLLEALQKFNESRKLASSTTLPSTPLSSLAGSSKTSSFINQNQTSNSTTAAALAKLLPSLLKKPVTPLAALPKKSAPPTMPIFSYKKPIVLRPKQTPSTAASSSSTNFTTPNLSTPNSIESNPSFSISIKETMNPLLASLIAASKKQSPKFAENDSNDKPPTLTDFSSSSSDDVGKEKCEILKINNNCETEELPPNLDIFNDRNESEDEEEPPKLECEIKEKMAVTRSQNHFSTSDNSLRQVTKLIRKPPKKRGVEAVIAAAKSENSPMINNEMDFDAPPALDLYGDKKSAFRASSTSSGVSSIGEFHSPPSCSPLAPINGNFSRSKPTKEPTTTARTVAKRKSKTPPASEKSKKRPRRSRKASEPAANLENQNWIPIGKPWAEMVSVGSSTTKKAVCCFPAVKHKTENITFNILDVISVAAGEDDNIGKIDRIFFDKKLGMCANVLWYYKYDQCVLKDENREEVLQNYNFDERELVASKHVDTISCDSIQSHAFVLTFSEYCRYVAETKYDVLPPLFQTRCKELWPRGEDNYPRRRYLPHEDTPQELVFFCRKYYSVNRKAISSGPPVPKATRRSKRQRKQRSITRLLPLEDSDDSENRDQTP